MAVPPDPKGGRDPATAATEPRPETSVTAKLVALINEREREQARVARILHDRASQVLSAVGLQLDVMKMEFGDQAPGLGQRTAEIQNMLESVIEELRGLS